jgi:hypothetical protein
LMLPPSFARRARLRFETSRVQSTMNGMELFVPALRECRSWWARTRAPM